MAMDSRPRSSERKSKKYELLNLVDRSKMHLCTCTSAFWLLCPNLVQSNLNPPPRPHFSEAFAGASNGVQFGPRGMERRSVLPRVEWNGVPFCPAWNGTAFRFVPRGMERRSILTRVEWNGVPFYPPPLEGTHS